MASIGAQQAPTGDEFGDELGIVELDSWQRGLEAMVEIATIDKDGYALVVHWRLRREKKSPGLAQSNPGEVIQPTVATAKAGRSFTQSIADVRTGVNTFVLNCSRSPLPLPRQFPDHVEHHLAMRLIEAVVGLDQLLCVGLEAVDARLRWQARQPVQRDAEIA